MTPSFLDRRVVHEVALADRRQLVRLRDRERLGDGLRVPARLERFLQLVRAHLAVRLRQELGGLVLDQLLRVLRPGLDL